MNYLITLSLEKILFWKKVGKKSWVLDPRICKNTEPDNLYFFSSIWWFLFVFKSEGEEDDDDEEEEDEGEEEDEPGLDYLQKENLEVQI